MNQQLIVNRIKPLQYAAHQTDPFTGLAWGRNVVWIRLLWAGDDGCWRQCGGRGDLRLRATDRYEYGNEELWHRCLDAKLSDFGQA
jgi:hypothetical protein